MLLTIQRFGTADSVGLLSEALKGRQMLLSAGQYGHPRNLSRTKTPLAPRLLAGDSSDGHHIKVDPNGKTVSFTLLARADAA